MADDNETQSETVSSKKKKYKKVIAVFSLCLVILDLLNNIHPLQAQLLLLSFSIVCIVNRKKVQLILW